MILIFSESSDISTQKVCEWLDYKNIDYLIFDNENKINSILITISKKGTRVSITTPYRNINLEDITSIWYRRGTLEFTIEHSFDYDYPKEIMNIFKRFQFFEIKKLNEFLNYKFNSLCKVNCENDTKINKIIILEEALKVGLQIPHTIITNPRKMIKKRGNFITKAISEALLEHYQDYMLRTFTKEVDLTIGKSSFPTLFQEKIEKQFEIRSFFLNQRFYSIAIFSQQRKATLVDYKNYNFESKNRCVPIKLPTEIETKCLKLIKTIGLNSGSIDFIYGKGNKFYFLEINPVGQFDNVSRYGNYYLENEIANIVYGN